MEYYYCGICKLAIQKPNTSTQPQHRCPLCNEGFVEELSENTAAVPFVTSDPTIFLALPSLSSTATAIVPDSSLFSAPVHADAAAHASTPAVPVLHRTSTTQSAPQLTPFPSPAALHAVAEAEDEDPGYESEYFFSSAHESAQPSSLRAAIYDWPTREATTRSEPIFRPRKQSSRAGTTSAKGRSRMQITQVPEDSALNTETCIICMENMQAKETVCRLACSHTFHEACIMHWLRRHSNCPVCRCEVLEEESDDDSNSDFGLVEIDFTERVVDADAVISMNDASTAAFHSANGGNDIGVLHEEDTPDSVNADDQSLAEPQDT